MDALHNDLKTANSDGNLGCAVALYGPAGIAPYYRAGSDWYSDVRADSIFAIGSLAKR
jgi:hypothetical protein